MEERNIYQDIAQRTGGDIYIGVVGPVRTGKSTFIKRFMDTLVIPNIGSAYQKDRAVDEMPQSAAGRTIMTTEPKFVPGGGRGGQYRRKRQLPGADDRLRGLYCSQRPGIYRG